MTGFNFAGSTGLMDVPAPDWIKDEESIFSQWGQFLLAMIKHGQVETVRRNETLPMAANEFGLMIDGGLYALEATTDVEARSILIQFLARGDLFTSTINDTHHLRLTPHCKTVCLVVRQTALDAFINDFPAWVRAKPLMVSRMALAYSEAVRADSGRDQDKILRVLTMLASHPTAIDSKLGREVEAGKQQIRDLAGVQKRSATRAFHALVESGCVSFYGYKRLFSGGN